MCNLGIVNKVCTFVYGFNDQQSRVELWIGLKQIASRCDGPWMILGDFNALSCTDDIISNIVRMAEIASTRDCMNFCQLTDVKAIGRYYTWSQKQDGEHRVLLRIYKVLAKQGWIDMFEQAEVSSFLRIILTTQ